MAIVEKNLDFLIIGSGKSGTTSLADLINQHPDVLITNPKEPWFFDTNDYKNGMGWYWKQYLKHYAGERFVGEASSQTLFVPYAAERLRQTIPDAKLIVILRNPIERAYSDWWMKSCSKFEKEEFDEAIIQNISQIDAGIDFSDPELWQSYMNVHKEGRLLYRTYVDYGFYAKQLERYYTIFPKKQIHVLLFEDLIKDPNLTAKAVWEFLGLENYSHLTLDTSPKNSAERRFYSSFMLLVRKFTIISSVAVYLPSGFKQFVHSVLRRVGRKKGHHQPSRKISDALNVLYKNDIEQLELQIQRDLSAWKIKVE